MAFNFKQTLPKILTLIAAALIIIIAAGTIISLATRKTPVADSWRQADPTPQKVINLSKKKGEHLAAYTQLGQIRAVTKPASEDSNGTLLVISPWFSYPEGDTVLFEELAQKERQEKAIIMEYVSRYTADELRQKGEKAVKDDLCHAINEQLVLGKITGIYFNDYIFFE